MLNGSPSLVPMPGARPEKKRYRHPCPVSRPKSLIQLVQIEDEIAKSVKVPVDLVTEKSVSPYLSSSIHRDEVVIYG